MKKTVFKNFMVLFVAFAIAAVSVLAGGGEGYSVGAGNGTNAKITSIEEASQLFESFISHLSGGTARGGAASLLASETEGGESESVKYESMTLAESSSVSMNYLYGEQYGEVWETQSMNVSMIRDILIYLTEDGAFYDSVARVCNDSVTAKGDEREEQRQYISLKTKIYISKEKILMRFDEFTIIQNGIARVGVEPVYGRWVDLTKSGDSAALSLLFTILSANAMNLSILSIIDRYVTGHMEEFEKNGNEYAMPDSLSRSFWGDILSLNGLSASYLNSDFDGRFLLNLESPTRPAVTLGITDEYFQSGGELTTNTPWGEETTYQPRISLDMSEEDILTFSNINNTKISISENMAFLSFDEFAQIMEKAFSEE